MEGGGVSYRGKLNIVDGEKNVSFYTHQTETYDKIIIQGGEYKGQWIIEEKLSGGGKSAPASSV